MAKNEEIKTRPRGGIKSKVNNFQPGRNTICVPMSNFSGISSNASFQSKLLFFNGGKPPPKQKKIGTGKTITEESEKKNNIEKDDINSNININNLLNSKNNNNNKSNNTNTNSNKTKDLENPRKYTYVKKNSVSFSSNQINSLIASFESKPSTSSSSNKEKKTENKTEKIILKDLKDQWKFQKILLDYNILDFTSK